MNIWKKGSKSVRNTLCYVKHEFIPHNMVKFADNTETIIGLENAKYLNSLWIRGYFSNDFRMFLFKMHNNTLPFNTILSHFVRGTGRNCTFCDILENPESEDENILHLFYNCQISERLRHNFLNWLTDGDINNASRREFFTGFRMLNNYYNETLNISCKLFMKFLWDCRCRKTTPRMESLKDFICDELQTMAHTSKIFKETIFNSGHSIRDTINLRHF
jgi:hypothetical protein